MAGSSKREKIMEMPTEFTVSDIHNAGIYASGTLYVWIYRKKGPPFFLRDGRIYFKKKDFLIWDEARPDRRTKAYKAGQVKK